MEFVILIVGFLLAAYSVIGNDVIQTLGTFINSNKKYHWSILWGYASLILSITLLYSWFAFNGDVSYQRLDNIPLPEQMHWKFLLAPLALFVITRLGIPVSTTFMILSVFSAQQVIGKMVLKSVYGYAFSFITAFVIYMLVSKALETKESIEKLEKNQKNNFWLIAQWGSTGFLWSQWLIQDFANIFVFLPRQLPLTYMLLSLLAILIIMALIFMQKGGKIQEIVNQKTNSNNIRSATIIDLIYGAVLFIYGNMNSIPMSTTWTFIGILAGRELAINVLMNKNNLKNTFIIIRNDLFKVTLGLLVSVLIVYLIKFI